MHSCLPQTQCFVQDVNGLAHVVTFTLIGVVKVYPVLHAKAGVVWFM